MALIGLILALPLVYVLGSFAYQIIYYRFLHPLRTFPGPFWASVTRLWITYHNVNGDEPTTFQELHRIYGQCTLPCLPKHGQHTYVVRKWLPSKNKAGG